MSQERTLNRPSALRRQPENDVAVALERTAHPRQAIDNGPRQPHTVLAVGRPLNRPDLGAGGSIEAIAANASALIATRITIQRGGRAFS
jgi:hypothetical protein